MRCLRVSMLVVGACFLLAIEVPGQAPETRDAHSVSAAGIASAPVEPDSPASSTSHAGSGQAASGTVVPRLMKFSGVLSDATGKPLSGIVDVTFSLYNTEAGGDALWFETQSVQADELGRYTALLGAMHSDGLPVELFTSGEVRWLGIQVGTEPEQQPRVLLVSVPYALKAGDAETLGGKPASAYVLADSASGTAASGTTSSTTGASPAGIKGATEARKAPSTGPQPNVSGTGNTNFLAKWTDNAGTLGNSMIFDTGTNVGVGTSTPGAVLDVQNPSTQNNIALRATNSSGTMMLIPNLSAGAYNGLVQAGDQGFIFYGTAPGAGNFVLGPWSSGGGLRMTSAGKVGIGTATPAAMLEVGGTAQSDNAVTLATGQALAGPQLDVQTPVNQNTIALRTTNTSGTMMFIPNLGPGAYNNLVQAGDQGLIFYGTAPNAGNFVIAPWVGAGSPGIRLTAAGNVGIGTGTPAALLDVNGTANFSGPVTFAAGQNFGTSTSMVTGSTGAFTGSNLSGVLNVTQSGTGAAAVLNNTVGGNILAGQNNGTQEFAVDGSGNVTLSGALNLPLTTGAGAGIITIGGSSFIHACCGTNRNTFVGLSAGNLSTTGSDNTAIGRFALLANTTGSDNTASGDDAMGHNTTGLFNTASGFDALFLNDTANQDAAFGHCALINTFGTTSPFSSNCRGLGLTMGSGNTAIGFTAGQTNTTGTANTFLGYQADASSGTLTNATAIGANAVVGESNALVLGGTGPNAVNVGIGTATPATILDIVGNTTGGAGLATHLTNTSTSTNSFSVFSAVSNNGTVVNQMVSDRLGTSGVLGTSVAGGYFGTFTSQPIGLVTGNALRVFIGSTGNVGIGTRTPAATLEVNGTAQFDQPVVFAAGQSFATTSGTGMFTDSTSNQVLAVTQTGSGASAVLNNTGGGPILKGEQNGTAVFTVANNGGISSSSLVLQPSVTETSSGRTFVGANVIGGFAPGTNTTGANVMATGVTGATIAGGGGTDNALTARNIVTDDWGTVGGGYFNQAGNGTGTVSDAIGATVAGGEVNTASGKDSTVAGGSLNIASGIEATVAGGTGNTASGDYSYAAGCGATAANPGAFVWSGFEVTSCTTVSSTAAGQFVALAPGGIKFYTNTGLTAGVTLAAGGSSWTMVSDRHAKRAFEPVGGQDLLAKLNRIPISAWSYKSQNPSIRHLGPMAQDFYAAFHLGETDKGIDEIDGQGVALAGVQALYRLSLEKDAQIDKLKAEVERLKRVETEMTALEVRLARLENQGKATRTARDRTTSRTRKPTAAEIARAGF